MEIIRDHVFYVKKISSAGNLSEKCLNRHDPFEVAGGQWSLVEGRAELIVTRSNLS